MTGRAFMVLRGLFAFRASCRLLAFRAILALLTISVLVPACSKSGKNAGAPSRLNVSASIFPVYDLARRVAGPDADVTLVVPVGMNIHSYAPTKADAEAAAKVNVAVMVGLGLDTWMENLVKDASPKARVLKVGDRVPLLEAKDIARPASSGSGTPVGPAAIDGDDERSDPHVWLDPARARLIVRAIAEELGKADAPHALEFRKRATELDAAIAALDTEIETRTKAWKTRAIVTHRASFQYFADRYGLEVVGVVADARGATPRPDPRPKLLEAIKSRRIPALFAEPQIDGGEVKVLADEAKIPLGVLDPVGGTPDTDSYEKLIRFDVAQLEEHLK